jgi:ketosteroid isomerase-like protein
MSQENVELAREVFDAVTQQNLSRLIDLTDPEVEWQSFFALGEAGGVYRGHSGIQRYVSDINDAWELVHPDIHDGVGVGSVVVLVGQIHYRGRGSGVQTESPAGWMLKFRNGKVLRFRAFRDPEQALEAAGLRE